MHGAQQSSKKIYLNMSLAEVEGEFRNVITGGYKDNIRYWCNNFKSKDCDASCTRCLAVAFTNSRDIVFIKGVKEPPKVVKIERLNYTIYDALSHDYSLTYDTAMGVVNEEIVNGMTLSQVKLARSASKFEGKYFCNLKQENNCDALCTNCSVILYEYDYLKGNNKTIYFNSYGSINFTPTVKRVEPYINRSAIPN